jgi:hypothetical protein
MGAIVQDRYGSSDAWQLTDTNRPEIEPHEVLVRVHAAGLDRPDRPDRYGPTNSTRRDPPALRRPGASAGQMTLSNSFARLRRRAALSVSLLIPAIVVPTACGVPLMVATVATVVAVATLLVLRSADISIAFEAFLAQRDRPYSRGHGESFTSVADDRSEVSSPEDVGPGQRSPD